MMNIINKMLIACCLGALMMLTGCGGDSGGTKYFITTPTGKVVKGPVVGASVFDSTGTKIGTTDDYGNFPLSGTGPYHTTGGTYTPLKADGTPGTPLPAPPMKAPAGVSQITPLSTLYADATVEQKAQIDALLATLGVSLSTDMSAKLPASAANASGVNALVALNEALGADLQIANTSTATQATAIKAAMYDAIATLSTKTKTELTTNTATVITAAITTAVNAKPELATISSQLIAAASTAAQGVENYGAKPLPIPTGSTGGSSSGTTL